MPGWMGWARWPAGCRTKTREETQKILDLFISQHKTFALEWQGRVVGSLGIEPYDEENYPELAHTRAGSSAMFWPSPAGAWA